ncbi:MAG: zinc ribbon domain-containing protein [Dehalococcoidales bacterium]|nr:zinc ribbon domain-containing protein [Dehalococcoidales bacterium]
MTEDKKAQIIGLPHLDNTYMVEMDIWPLEGEEQNRIYPFYDNLREGRFTTTKCKACGHTAYPPQVICPKCWSEDLEWVDLPKKARVVTLTETQAGAPIGFPTPLIMAWLTFGDDTPLRHMIGRIVNCKEGELNEGDEVQIVVFDVPAHPQEIKRDTVMKERVFYAFEPVKK